MSHERYIKVKYFFIIHLPPRELLIVIDKQKALGRDCIYNIDDTDIERLAHCTRHTSTF